VGKRWAKKQDQTTNRSPPPSFKKSQNKFFATKFFLQKDSCFDGTKRPTSSAQKILTDKKT